MKLDQVFVVVSVLCWLAARTRCKCSMEASRNLVLKLVGTLLNYRILGTSTATVFLSNYLYAPI